MAKQYRTRNLIDLQVGESHSIQIILHLRCIDLTWFNANSQEYISQLLKIMADHVLPKECKDDIERYHIVPYADNNSKDTSNDEKQSESGGKKRKRKDATNNQINAKSTGKRKGSSNSITSKSSSKKGDIGTDQKKNEEATKFCLPEVFKSHNTFLFAKNIQILYKCDNVQRSSTAILNYIPMGQVKNTNKADEPESMSTTNKATSYLSKFKSLTTIPKVITVWCYPFDEDNPFDNTSELNRFTAGHTFPSPDLIPISSLFFEK